MLTIYNTLTRKKEEFKPLHPGVVNMYVCGPTVYNYIHIGNARSAIAFDTVRRYLEFKGYKVNYVSNFTDVDDKMIKAAHEQGITIPQLAEKYINAFMEDTTAINIEPATMHPRATENIPDIIKFVSGLIDKGYAYEKDGDVYYRARKFKHYGQLSGQSIDDLEVGASEHVSADEVDKKEDPMDFALWKAAKPGEISWDSPWGKGRPGWHIECSVMSTKYLGKTIDIHAGGQDLEFPHHENEIAQSECCNGAPFAHYWMHNGYINVDNKKMSKSLGNFFTVRDVAEKYGYEPIRYLMVSSHYRMPINYSVDIIEQCKASLERLYNCRDNLRFLLENASGSLREEENAILDTLGKYREEFIAAMDDDLNTADGLAALFGMAREINSHINGESSKELCQQALDLYMELANVLGLLYVEKDNTLDQEIEDLIARRTEARKNKDWATADAIRDELKARHVVLEDTPQGVKWHIEG